MAGILDGYQFDPQAYGGGGGMGLLGLLAQQYGLPQPGQPAVGFPAPVTDYTGTAGALDPKWRALLAGNTDAYQQPQAQGQQAPPLGPPIDVPSLQVAGAGGYPSDAQLPPTSTPTAGTGLLGGNLFSGGASPAGPAPGAGQQPGIPAQPAAAGPGIGDRLGSAWQGLGQGGLTSAIGGLITGQRQDPQGLLERALVQRGVSPEMAHAGVKNPQLLPTLLQEVPQEATKRALVQAGVPEAVAEAAKYNPEVLKTVAAQLYTKPTIEKVKNAIGGEDMFLVDPVKGTRTELKDTGGGGGIGGGQGAPQMLAQGVKQYNPALTGNDYMNQFGPELQAVAKMYLKGDELPTGNPRIQGLFPFAKTIAAKYAQDMGIPFSDALYSEKRKFFTDLGSTSANSIGGQVKAFNQGMEHADKLSTKLEQLGNWDPIGEKYTSMGINTLRGLSTKQADIVNSAKALGQTLAGEVGKLFSGQAGGGVHERELTRERFNTVSSPRELAGALEGTLETMDGGLKALEQQRDRVLGPTGANQANFVTKETEAKIAHIREVIGRLRGDTAPQQGTASQQTAPPNVQEGATATNPKTGQRIIYKGGQWQPMK